MSKKTKKRNKQYKGADAAAAKPTVHRYSAVKRSRAGQWWQEKKRPVKIASIILFVILFLIIIITEIISLTLGGV